MVFFSGGPITGVFWLPIMIFIFVISAIVTFIQWIIKKAKEAKRKEGKLIQSYLLLKLKHKRNKKNR